MTLAAEISPTTTIHSNGGGCTLPIEALFDRLASDPLDRAMFDDMLIERDGDTTRFFGNFLTYSHVFHIDTSDPVLAEKLTAAIRANQQRPDYLAQATPAERRAAREAEIAKQDADRAAKRRAELTRTLAAMGA